MPDTLRELHAAILTKGKEDRLSGPQITYAVGWIFFDLFERASHDEAKGVAVSADILDRYAADLPQPKIERDIEEAQQDFGQVAAAFMDEEIQSRINAAIERSILHEIKSYTGSFKAFCLNVTAGVVAGFVFAALLFFCARIYEKDPSPKQIGALLLNGTKSESSIGSEAEPHRVQQPSK